jgi:hypothetical protein
MGSSPKRKGQEGENGAGLAERRTDAKVAEGAHRRGPNGVDSCEKRGGVETILVDGEATNMTLAVEDG